MIMKKIACLTAVFLFLSSVTVMYAAGEGGNDTRYFIPSTKSFWKNTFGVRNMFDDGFTTDLSDWQLRLAKIAGLKVIPVKKFTILPAIQDPQQSGIGSPDQRMEPTDHVPWGVQELSSTAPLARTSGGAGVTVAVLDTGAAVGHPDLSGRVKECKDFTRSERAVTDNECEDKNGHGTHVAGIIAAAGGEDHRGIYGMAPEADLFVYRVCANDGSCWADDIATALKTATDNGAQIVTMSFGSDSTSSLVSGAISYADKKGVLMIAAAGNDGPYPESIDYPASSTEVVSVGAIDVRDAIADWSSRGSNGATKHYERNEGDMELIAPGVNVESTWKDGGYAILSGTSMAAPHIAGLAAKLWVKDAEDPAEATRDLLHKITADIPPEGDDDASGWGLPQP